MSSPIGKNGDAKRALSRLPDKAPKPMDIGKMPWFHNAVRQDELVVECQRIYE